MSLFALEQTGVVLPNIQTAPTARDLKLKAKACSIRPCKWDALPGLSFSIVPTYLDRTFRMKEGTSRCFFAT